MTSTGGMRTPIGEVVRSSLRAVLTVAILITLYYLLPVSHVSTWIAVTVMSIGLVVLIALVGYQVHSVMTATRPVLRAIEALAVSVPFFLVLFATSYLAMEKINVHSFSQSLIHTDALYFTVTVFATVGFGDITPTSEAARLVVTGQMIGDLLIIGIAIRAIITAVQRRRSEL